MVYITTLDQRSRSLLQQKLFVPTGESTLPKTTPASSAASVLVSAKTPAVIAKKKVAKIAKQKPAHGSKRYTEAERNVILGKKKAGVPLSALKKEYGVTPKTIGKWLKKAKASGSAPKAAKSLISTTAKTGTNDQTDVVLTLTQAIRRQEAYLGKLKGALAALTG